MKSKITAALLCLFFGWCGFHRFYLGHTLIGLIQFISIGLYIGGSRLHLPIAFIWALIDFVRIITGSLLDQDKFYKKINKLGIKIDDEEKNWWNESFIIDESKLQPRFEYILKNKFLIKEIVTEDSLKKIKDKVILLENNINNEISELTNKDQWWSLDDRHKELTKNYWWFDEIAEGSLRLIVRNYIEECLLSHETIKLIDYQEFIDFKEKIKKQIEEKEKEELEKRLESGETRKSKGEPFCCWCGEGRSKYLEYIDGSETGWDWHFRNKDGSRDQRAKDNYQVAGFVSNWKCQNCNSNLKARHFSTEKPSKKVEIWKLELITNGDGERVSDDWVSDEGVSMAGAHHRQHEN